MRKILGYLVAIVGLVGVIAYSFAEVKAYLFTEPAKINDMALLAISIIIVVLGILVVLKSKPRHSLKKGMEVPIYHGHEVVGFRRV